MLRHFRATFHNAAGIRRDTFDGCDHLVVPVVAVRSQVLGNEFLPADEIQRTVKHEMWEGRPLTLGHPMERGQFVSVNQEFLDRRGIGHLFNVEWDPRKEAMKGEAWVDIQAANDKRPGLVETLEDADPDEPVVEVSTGYVASLEPRLGQTDEGERFNGIQRNLVPNHLAFLFGQEGKCSIEDGCGAPRMNAREEGVFAACTCGGHLGPTFNALDQARQPDFDGTAPEDADWDRPDGAAIIDGLGLDIQPGTPWPEWPAAAREEAASLSLLGDPEADTVQEGTFFIVVDPDGRRLNANALEAVRSIAQGGRGGADIPDDAAQSAFRMAGRLLNQEFDRGLDVRENAEGSGVGGFAEWLNRNFGIDLGQKTNANPGQGADSMDREDRITAIVANEDAPFDADDLEGMEDDQVEAIHTRFCENAGDGDAGDAGETPDGSEGTQANDDGEDIPAAWMEFMRDHDPDVVANAVQEAAQEKDDLVDDLADREDCHLERSELEGMQVNSLQALQRTLDDASGTGRADFRAQGGPRSGGGGSSDGERADPAAAHERVGSDA